MPTTTLSTVFAAGIGNSEHDHWQSIWARTTARSVWVDQRDWDHPICTEWGLALETVLRATPGPKIVVAHSLGCLLVAAEAETCRKLDVIGALLVSVPDTHGPKFPRLAVGFPAAHSTKLSFPSMVVASTDDPYGSVAQAERAAENWKSEFVCVGAKGHINLKSNLGEWKEGRDLLNRFTGALTTARAG
jgi:uncharacterized protein